MRMRTASLTGSVFRWEICRTGPGQTPELTWEEPGSDSAVPMGAVRQFNEPKPDPSRFWRHRNRSERSNWTSCRCGRTSDSRTFNRIWVQVRFWSALRADRPVMTRLGLLRSEFDLTSWFNLRAPMAHRPQDPEGNTPSRDGRLNMAAPVGRLLLLTLLLFRCGSGCGSGLGAAETVEAQDCRHLRLGQYLCRDPKIDESTQEPETCRDGVALVDCLPAPNVTCRLSNGTEVRFSGDEVGFNRTVACRNVTGYSYKVAVALSLFLGWLGADRFYLGYPALGLLKFCTVGFCGIGTLIDFILIAMQMVGPADGSSYIVDFYGARLTRLSITNETFRKPHLAL